MFNKIVLNVPLIILCSLTLLSKKTLASISCDLPLEIELLTKNLPATEVVTANTFSQDSMTIPSLWWTKEQFDIFGGRLVNNWLADPETKRIDLIVNPQLWNIMDYIQRYRLVNNFGLISRKYNYNLRVVTTNAQCLALYYYNPNSDPPKWELDLSPSTLDSLELSR
jgi:hypothetical protein